MPFNNRKLNFVRLYVKEVLSKIIPLYNAFSIGKKTPKIAPSPWNCVTPPEEDRATAKGNMREKFGKDRACGLGDMLADRQTDTHTDVLITIFRHRCCRRSNNDKVTLVTLLPFLSLG